MWKMRLKSFAKAIYVCLCVILLSGCVSYHASYNPETGFIDVAGSRLGDQQISVTIEKEDNKITMKIEQLSEATALNSAMETINRLAK